MPYLKCHICTLKYSKCVLFGDNLAVNSITTKMMYAWFELIKKLCKPKSDKNFGYDYVNRNQDSEKGRCHDNYECTVIGYDLSFNVTNASIT